MRLLLPLLVAAGSASATVPCIGSGSGACHYGIESLQLQRGPAVFRFSARVSAAKLPNGSGVFKEVLVNLLSGTEILCKESLPKVEVTDGVLNLEIGRGMSCALEEVIAENSELAFQVCLGGPGACLAPVRLGAVPYAVKATYAAEAVDAGRAQEAARAEWAHRLTADAELTQRTTLGNGYFDFHTHAVADALALYDAAEYAPYAKSGFVQWTPTVTGSNTLHVAAGVPHGPLTSLDALHVAAKRITARGDLFVSPASPGLSLDVAGAALVVGDSSTGSLDVAAAITVGSGGLHIAAGGLTVSLGGTLGGAFAAGGRLTNSAGGATVTGDSSLDGGLTTGGALLISGGSLAFPEASSISGAATIATQLTVQGDLVVTGTARILGLATFEQGFTTANAADLRYVQYAGDSRALTLAGGVTFAGGLALGAPASLSGALVDGRLEQAAAPPVTCDAAHSGYLYLDTTTKEVTVCSDAAWKPIATTVCGDGLVQLGEDCDDSARIDGDGCAATCTVEAGYTCTQEPSECTQ